MAKRFTVTEKWDDPWFELLTPQAKLIWEYIRDNCNHVGIWKVNLNAVRRKCGFSERVDVEKHLNEMNEKAKEVEENDKIEWLEGKKFVWIVNFIKVQYGEKFNPKSSMHRTILNELSKYVGKPGLPKQFGLFISSLQTENLYPTSGVEVGYKYPNGNGNGKGKNIENLTIVGSERANEALQKALSNPIWLENIMSANGMKEATLKKWLNRFAASVTNDVIPNFSNAVFQKMFNGWLPNQIHIGKTVPDNVEQQEPSFEHLRKKTS